MPTILTTKAVEGSSFVITAIFKDKNGSPLTPKTLKWTLTDKDGNIVNSREDVTIAVPTSTVNIVVSGNDLIPGFLIMTITGTYDSELGSNLPLVDTVEFEVLDLVDVIPSV